MDSSFGRWVAASVSVSLKNTLSHRRTSALSRERHSEGREWAHAKGGARQGESKHVPGGSDLFRNLRESRDTSPRKMSTSHCPSGLHRQAEALLEPQREPRWGAWRGSSRAPAPGSTPRGAWDTVNLRHPLAMQMRAVIVSVQVTSKSQKYRPFPRLSAIFPF